MIRLHGIPIYWGIEKDAPDRSLITRAFLNEVLPPYRESDRAIRIRVSHRHWLHVGIHTYKTEVTPWGLEVLPGVIGGEWGWNHVEEEEPDDSGTDEVRQAVGE